MIVVNVLEGTLLDQIHTRYIGDVPHSSENRKKLMEFSIKTFKNKYTNLCKFSKIHLYQVQPNMIPFFFHLSVIFPTQFEVNDGFFSLLAVYVTTIQL